MNHKFDTSFVGVQIAWSEDQEIEYLGPAVLAGTATSTAANCVRGKMRIRYAYPITESMPEPSRLIISYSSNPLAWPDSWGWEVYKGDLIVNFRKGGTFIPESIAFLYLDSGKLENLIEGEDWVYRSAEEVVVPAFEPRGRLQVTRLDRRNQAWLRYLLLSEYGACQITGTKCPAALEVCHIVPVKNGGLDEIGNALLLRRDLHSLFDAGLLRFRLSGARWVVDVDSEMVDEQYRNLNGRVLMRSGLQSHRYLQARQNLAKFGVSS
jgi:hypothetical protein